MAQVTPVELDDRFAASREVRVPLEARELPDGQWGYVHPAQLVRDERTHELFALGHALLRPGGPEDATRPARLAAVDGHLYVRVLPGMPEPRSSTNWPVLLPVTEVPFLVPPPTRGQRWVEHGLNVGDLLARRLLQAGLLLVLLNHAPGLLAAWVSRRVGFRMAPRVQRWEARHPRLSSPARWVRRQVGRAPLGALVGASLALSLGGLAIGAIPLLAWVGLPLKGAVAAIPGGAQVAVAPVALAAAKVTARPAVIRLRALVGRGPQGPPGPPSAGGVRLDGPGAVEPPTASGPDLAPPERSAEEKRFERHGAPVSGLSPVARWARTPVRPAVAPRGVRSAAARPPAAVPDRGVD